MKKSSNNWSQRAGQLRPSVGGLFDIHGKLWEWVDGWHARGAGRVIRGGGWVSGAAGSRAAHRSNVSPTIRISSYGSRLALSPSS